MLIENYCVWVIASVVILQHSDFSPSNNVTVICYIDSPYDICYCILCFRFVILTLQMFKIVCVCVCVCVCACGGGWYVCA